MTHFGLLTSAWQGDGVGYMLHTSNERLFCSAAENAPNFVRSSSARAFVGSVLNCVMRLVF